LLDKEESPLKPNDFLLELVYIADHSHPNPHRRKKVRAFFVEDETIETLGGLLEISR